jgi:magnesium transporter
MLKVLRKGAAAFETPELTEGWRLPDDAVWVELVEPTKAEEKAVEQSLGLELPTREEMAQIEVSSRLYQDAGATFMTAAILTHSEDEFPVLAPVTFVLAGDRLVTIRYVEPRAFRVFTAHMERQPGLCPSAAQTFMGLLDATVERIADILERVSSEVEVVSQDIFRRPRQGGFEPLIAQLGRAQMVNAKARDSLVSLARVISFAALAPQIEDVEDQREHLKTLQRDAQSLTDHAGHVAANITFLLDAAMGLINIEQNSIIKIFSVAAVAFLPPTLIASVYGMNFRHMPELDWLVGYPFAMALMVFSALVPLWWFRRKGWL